MPATLVDEVIIEVSSGKGGDGSAAFRREKYVPRGGPAGGDGGRGGSIIFTCRKNLRTLSHLRYKQKYKAQDGEDGRKSMMDGRAGEDLVIPVPPGTVLKNADTGLLIHDFAEDATDVDTGKKKDFLFLKGGNGGWGNIHFKTSVKQAPQKALPGKPGLSARVLVELQIIADIGLVGFPNAGKSTLLDKFTNARPKIAPYPFTTKIPNLGVLRVDDHDIILADIPGLIEGASEGAGLGIRFLKHIARTCALAFLIDLSESNFLEAFDILKNELGSYSSSLLEKQRVIIGTKLDIEGAPENLVLLKKKYPNERVLGISVHSGSGLKELYKVFSIIAARAEDA